MDKSKLDVKPDKSIPDKSKPVTLKFVKLIPLMLNAGKLNSPDSNPLKFMFEINAFELKSGESINGTNVTLTSSRFKYLSLKSV